MGLNVSRKTKKIRHEAKKLTNDRCLSQNKERNKLLALRWLKPPAFSPSLNTPWDEEVEPELKKFKGLLCGKAIPPHS